MILDTFFIILIAILIIVLIIKGLQLTITTIAKTSKDRYYNIYQGGEIIKARNRRYYSNLYTLIILFLILHVIVFLIASIALIQLNTSIGFEIMVFLIIFVYTIIIIRKGVNYS